jgi:cytochrome c biogenesis protein CcmG/thiol:disulfide interchange protein DsbE
MVTARRSRTALWVSLSVGVVLVAFIGFLATRESGADRRANFTLKGKTVPEVAGPTLDGDTYDIATKRGQWQIVNFFATWCVPCQQEHPELVAFDDEHRALGDAGVVSIAFQDDPESLKRFFADNGGDWPVIIGETGSFAVDFGVTGVPESYVVNPNGVVVAKFEGVTRMALNQIIGTGEQP